jgi:GntR family transcriptional repressor for pyruvate dehydrogenase complex
VYVTRDTDVLVLASPDFSGTLTKKLLLDLIEARTPIELRSTALAARNLTEEHLQEMRRLLAIAEENLANDDTLTSANMDFHRQIALASGNTVLAQLLNVLQELFVGEQRLILGIFGSRQRDHEEHLGILQALEQRNEALAVDRMKQHLEGVHEVLEQWDPEQHPVR